MTQRPPQGDGMDPDDLPPLREVIARHGLDARKGLGQHFLLDLNLTRRVARTAGDLGAGSVIEVGPGPGGLTRALLAEGAREVIAIEKDPRCIGALAELATAYPERLTVLEADALRVDVCGLGVVPRRIVANLPYNVSTALLIGWLRALPALDDMVLMFQKEVADRLCAAHGTRAYGRLSVLAQWLCEVEAVFDITPRAFTPPPKVVSTVVRLTPRNRPLADVSFARVERMTATLFSQRRKMIRSPLRALGNPEAICATAGVDPTARADHLSVAEILRLAQAVSDQR